MLAGTAMAREPSDPSYGIYAYTAREWDPEINLYYYRARYYDPKVGRFISEDPARLSGGMNFYAYVGNRPTNLVDPTGEIGIVLFVTGLYAIWHTSHCIYEWRMCRYRVGDFCSAMPAALKKRCIDEGYYYCADDFAECFLPKMACHVMLELLFHGFGNVIK